MSKSFCVEPNSRTPMRAALRAAVTPLLAGSMLAGAFAAWPATARDRSVDKASAALAENDADRAVRHAENAVAEAPRDAGRRALLGQAYLKAGRLTSARNALGEAVSLGDASARVALMLALAEIGSGSPRSAVAILAQQGDAIAAADRGLAFALAGETARGVEVISADIRGGNDTPKSRQNLAYAYALDGRWREARLMAAQDVPLDVLDRRMTEWAMNARPEYAAARVAALVGATVQADRGMPTELALANFPAAKLAIPTVAPPVARPGPVIAAAKPAPAPAPVMAPPAAAVVAAPKPVLAKALAPVVVARAEPIRSEVKVAAVPASKAAAPIAATPRAFAPPTTTQPKLSAKPTAAKASPAKAPTTKVSVAKVPPAPAAKSSAKRAALVLPAAGTAGTHVAQLGSYSSESAARAGWKVFQSRYTNLKGLAPVITRATVDGKNYWRVAAGGFDARTANQMCQAVKASGSGCLPIAKATGKAVRVAKVD